MKTRTLSLVALVLGLPLGAGAARAPTLHVRLEPRFGDVPLVCDSGVYRSDAGQSISVSRLDLLASDFTLRRQQGGWLGPDDWSAYVSAREGQTVFDVPGIPRGRYDRLAFFIGLPPAVNRADPSVYGPQHPLNPNVNGLHWGWQGGYVFLAIEGGWLPDGEERRGYSYHLATDRQIMRVELPVDLTVTNDVEVHIAFDVRHIFGGSNVIRLEDDTATTHSREGDLLADQLRRNIEDAFSVSAVRPLDTVGGKPQPPNVTLVARDATPYRLTIPRYFSPPRLPTDNPLTEEGVRLGSLLFFDPRLSVNNSQSCASCHHSEAGFTDPGQAVSRGAEGHAGERNSMPLFNLAWKSSFFWDGRAASLREQVLQPIQNPIEMHETLENVVAKLKSSRVNSRHKARALQSAIPNPESESGQNAHRLTAAATKNDYPSLFGEQVKGARNHMVTPVNLAFCYIIIG